MDGTRFLCEVLNRREKHLEPKGGIQEMDDAF